jgi:exonuclease III
VASWNVDGYFVEKIERILAYAIKEELDIFALQEINNVSITQNLKELVNKQGFVMHHDNHPLAQINKKKASETLHL